MQPLGPEDPPQAGAYRLLGRLGGGGMGTVYLGRNAGGRTVAVKLIRVEFAADSEFRRRFQLEVAAARRVSGRWTPPVLDADTEGRQPWVATAYVPGPDLAEALRRFGPLPADSIRTLGAGLAEALLAVHGLGLVHRDLKPSNVVLSLDGPRMIDFGIARALDGTGTALTQTGSVIGSPGYMSPEQAMGHAAGPASDVFSLGAVLATAVTGRPPFGEGPTGVAVMYRVLHEQPDLHGLPDDLRDIIEACLDKNPARRPSPQQVRAHLLPGADTIPQTGWLPPAISEAVARLATELLHLETPQVQMAPPLSVPLSPPPPPTQTSQIPPGYSAPVAGPVPRRRSVAKPLTITAVVLVAVGFLIAVPHLFQDQAQGTPTDNACYDAQRVRNEANSRLSTLANNVPAQAAVLIDAGNQLTAIGERPGVQGTAVGAAIIAFANDDKADGAYTYANRFYDDRAMVTKDAAALAAVCPAGAISVPPPPSSSSE